MLLQSSTPRFQIDLLFLGRALARRRIVLAMVILVFVCALAPCPSINLRLLSQLAFPGFFWLLGFLGFAFLLLFLPFALSALKLTFAAIVITDHHPLTLRTLTLTVHLLQFLLCLFDALVQNTTSLQNISFFLFFLLKTYPFILFLFGLF